jgi:hypothetical protein
MERKELILNIITIVFSMTIILMIINSIQLKEYYPFFWVCYPALIIVIIGLLKRNSSVVLSQIILIAIPDLLWISDFICLVAIGKPVLGLVSSFSGLSFFSKMGALQHLYIFPLSLLSLSLMKIRKNHKILLISFGEIILIFLLTLFLVPNTYDINCVHVTCIQFSVTFLPYTILWFLFEFGFIIISYFIITSLPFVKKNKAV